MGEILNGIAKALGETKRMRKTAQQESNMASEVRQQVEMLLERARSGDNEAMLELGNKYFRGDGVRYDPDEALHWWSIGAERGHMGCQFNVGLLYHGTISALYENPELAGKWLYAAAQQGYQRAQDILNAYYKYSNFSKKWKRVRYD